MARHEQPDPTQPSRQVSIGQVDEEGRPTVTIDGQAIPWALAAEPIRMEYEQPGIVIVYLPVLTWSVITQPAIHPEDQDGMG